jgi:hypothetical protein
MRKFQLKHCQICTTEYTPKAPAQKFCDVCGVIQAKKVSRAGVDRYRVKHGVRVGIGSGNLNTKGRNDAQYKNGITYFIKNRKRIKEERRYCERCSKDLQDVAWFMWVLHHKDHDRTNNTENNFELLCKRCHQLEHSCYVNFLKVQRLESNLVGNSVPEVPIILQG